MSEWQGFDLRKICPNCGQYQTRFGIPRRRLRIVPIPIILLMSVALLAFLFFLVFPQNPTVRLWGIVFTALIWAVIILIYASTMVSSRQHQGASQEFFLECRSCGHVWKMTRGEWEAAGQRELETFENIPSPTLPSNKRTSSDSFEPIEYKPPNKTRGVLIVIVAMITLTLVFIAGGWWIMHPGKLIIDSIGIILFFLFLFGTQALFKVQKGRFIYLVLAFLLSAIIIALRYLVK